LTTNGPIESDAPRGKVDRLPEFEPRTRIRLLFAFLVVGALFALLWFACSTLAPYVVGLFLAFLLLPIVCWVVPWTNALPSPSKP
jgi:predicted PurR-regulated permease PerM